ncbi:hypothetical protein [Chryseobacterium lathyri]|uniref:hypothetical protein n=1 Tax=Chryseobacterium lathyri TaxID=395933 RepID=UPI002782B1F7|nr:hypothetical protein [Chryseobacterium lathyri]MDQ0065272.1 hypothetical protein [Chryseobacterium lathyri]
MEKNVIILSAMLCASLVFSQVGINTSNPQQSFHVDGAKDNPATGAPTAAQQVNDFAVRNNGFVGVGTSVPASKVDITVDNQGGGAANSLVMTGYGNSKGSSLQIRAANGTAAAPTGLVTGDNIGILHFIPRHDGGFSGYTSSIYATYKGSGVTSLTNLNFNTSGAPRMTIDEFGNVGMGTEAPQGKLDVVSTTSGFIPPRLTTAQRDAIAAGSRPPGTTIFNTTDSRIQVNTGTDATPVWSSMENTNIYNANGDLTGNRTVGIGTNTLSFTGTTGAVSIVGNNDGLVRTSLRNTNTGTNTRNDIHIGAAASNIYLGTDRGSGIFGSGAKAYLDNQSGGRMVFGTVGTEQLTITTGGNVGVGINAPTDRLDVNGTARVRSLPVAAGPTVITPVYADNNGVLNKAVTATYGTIINNATAAVQPNATAALVTGLTDGGVYKATVRLNNGCNNVSIAEFYIINNSFSNLYSIKGIDGLAGAGTVTFTQPNRTTAQAVWSAMLPCQDGGDGTGHNYTLTMPAAGTINVTNNGNVPRGYSIIVTRQF